MHTKDQGAVYKGTFVPRAHFNPKAFEVSIYVLIKNCNCNKYSFKYL